MSRDDGPRVGALAFDGWDTHQDEGVANGRLAALLGALDGALAAVESGMGAAWKETAVAVITEFGRTARINGTEGTDHGTATIALLAGGAVKGGRVIADWPGLNEASLYQRPRFETDHRSTRYSQRRTTRPSARRRARTSVIGISR